MMPLMTRLNSWTVRSDPPRNVYISLLRSDRRKVITQMSDILAPSIAQKSESAGAAHPLNATTEPDRAGMARGASEGQSFHRSDRRCLRSWAGNVRAFHC